MTTKEARLDEAYSVLVDLGMPRQQLNERSALCLLALLDLRPDVPWSDISTPLIGITPIMDWVRDHYEKHYAPNTRETIRRQSMHQFIAGGICLYNPDLPARPVNSPKAVYQIEPNLHAVLRTFGSVTYKKRLNHYLSERQTLVEKYARARDMNMIPVTLKDGRKILLTPGEHSELIKSIVSDFGPRFAPGADLVYVGDTGDKHGFFDEQLLANLGIELDNHGKMPDVVLYMREKNWLLLIESVTSHGPVDAKRYGELRSLFDKCTAGLVYVSAFPSRKVFLKYLEVIAWESEVWVADAPTHLIHFNGVRFLGPYEQPGAAAA
ncbi:MAG: BsuBI/PstI family type II restriction endonuclease [Pseudomonadota bacterium]